MPLAIAKILYPDGAQIEARLTALAASDDARIEWTYPRDHRAPRPDPVGPWYWLRVYLEDHARITGGTFSESIDGDWICEDDVEGWTPEKGVQELIRRGMPRQAAESLVAEMYDIVQEDPETGELIHLDENDRPVYRSPRPPDEDEE